MATLFDGIGANGFSSGFAAGNEIRKQRGLASGAQAYVDAETAGDKAGMRKALGVMAGVAPVETMNWINQQKALEQKNKANAFGVGTAKGETLQAIALINDPNTPPEIKKQLQSLVDVRTKVPEVMYNTKYQETLGRKQAEQGIQDQKNKQEALGRARRISDLKSSVMNNKELLTPTSFISEKTGAWTGGNYGMSDKDRMTRGALLRDIADAKQQLIQRAKAHGQTGINQVREIEMATEGVDGSDWAKLLGALDAMERVERDLDGMDNGMSVVGTTPEQTDQEIVDYTSYFGG